MAGSGLLHVFDHDTASLALCEKQISEGSVDCEVRDLQTLHRPTRSAERASSPAASDIESTSGRSESQPKGPRDQNARKVVQFLLNNVISPPEACAETLPWLIDEQLCNINEKDENFKSAINWYKKYISHFHIVELYDTMYKNKNYIFDAIRVPFDVKYWSLKESLSKLEFFLLEQFGEEEAVYDFMLTLYKNQTNQGGKKGNTIWVKGTQDCGKSWFFDSLKSLQISHGSASILNKNNNFALAGIHHARVAYLDELNYDPDSYTNILKLLMSGNDLYTCKKYVDDVKIYRTPVIILSNNECLPNNDIFNSRMTRFYFKNIDASKYIYHNDNPNVIHNFFSKSINPLAFREYWIKFKIWGTIYITEEIKNNNE